MLYPVILCGGNGTRLWPLSRSRYPKQFMELGEGQTLFGQTLRRLHFLHNSEKWAMGAPIVVCNEDHRFYAAAALQEAAIPGGRLPRIILEPQGRNTAPAIALAALAALEEDSEALLLVLPSDHSLEPENSLVHAVQNALGAAQDGRLVTFGITPGEPRTSYGYIRCGEPVPTAEPVEEVAAQVLEVLRFVEKPDAATAAAMLNEGGYLWNSGMFFFRADSYVAELERLAPEMMDICQHAWEKRTQDKDFVRPDPAAFAVCPADSIDYVVMEHTQKAAVLPLHVRWSDLGSWDAFHDASADSADVDGNVCVGDVLAHKTKNSYVHCTHRMVATLGVDNLVVVETPDAVLVANRRQVQDVKTLVRALRAQGRREADFHNRVFRPWGSYECLAEEQRFQVKRIIVAPGASLSLQMHYHRAEHWVVVSGTAEITNGDKTFLLTENQSTYIPPGCNHRLRNPGIIPLTLIEIQSGAYLGEDDIVRFDDVYGRAGKESE